MCEIRNHSRNRGPRVYDLFCTTILRALQPPNPIEIARSPFTACRTQSRAGKTHGVTTPDGSDRATPKTTLLADEAGTRRRA